jgi:hypothetical protein
MRAAWMIGLALALGCGKELNPEYCTGHPNDTVCQVANETSLDAAPRCTVDSNCPNLVCDTGTGTCVQCTPSDQTECVAMHQVCDAVNTCVECVTNADCGGNSACLPDNTCAGSGTILYAAPGGSGSATSNDCTAPASPCSLTNAVGHATTVKNVIQLGGGSYDEGTITLAVAGLQLVVDAGAQVTITGSSNNNPLFAVTQSATITQMTLANSSGDGIKCSNNATLLADQLVITNSGNNAINIDSCTATITRSKLVASTQSALTTGGTTVLKVLNNFMYSGGNQLFTGGGAIVLGDHTTGEVRFNTIGYNQAADIRIGKQDIEYPAGFSCTGETSVTFADNLIVSDTPVEYSQFSACGDMPTQQNWIGDGSKVNFASTKADSMDLHLTSTTPNTTSGSNQAIRDNANTSCTGTDAVPNDFDNDVRPYNVSCDYGADEFTPTDVQ